MADTPEIVKPLFIETPPPPSKVDMEIYKLDSGRRSFYLRSKSDHDKSYNDFWNNPNATPQELCDKAGTKAILFFLISQKTQELLCMLNPEYVPIGVPEGCEVEYGQDGTVTITDSRPAPIPVPAQEPPLPPKPISTEPAPKIEWNREGTNPDFIPPPPPSE